MDRIVDSSGTATATTFQARLTPSTGDFGAADAVTAATGTVSKNGGPEDLTVPVAAGNARFQFGYAAVTQSDSYLSSYTQNWVCSKTSATSTVPIAWPGNGTIANPQQTPPDATWTQLAAGEFMECTVTYIPPYLTLVKTVDPTNGGTALPTVWTLNGSGGLSSLSGTTGSTSVTRVPVAVGDYSVGESAGPDGYRWSDFTCTSPSDT